MSKSIPKPKLPEPAAKVPASSFHPQYVLYGLLAVAAFSIAFVATKFWQAPEKPAAPPGMVYVPAGEFTMGSSNPKDPANERPVRTIQLDAFFMDACEVTNAQFAEFVKATGYITTAEKKPDWEDMKKQLPPDTPKPDDAMLVPGSMVFQQTKAPVPMNDVSQWWKWTPGACWKHPEGPTSNVNDRQDHPVVHVSWFDATAYAKWASKRLPTEAEWEYVSRAGAKGQRYTWGQEPLTDADGTRANIWQGVFPCTNSKADKWVRTAPVKTYPANAWGVHEMAGNVWEWCNDWYRADEYSRTMTSKSNPPGPDESYDPNEPYTPKRVIRGGSFLCHQSYCESYRNSARRGTSPDTGMSHTGFRCVKAIR
jgi:formylglycine-generating enzyme